MARVGAYSFILPAQAFGMRSAIPRGRCFAQPPEKTAAPNSGPGSRHGQGAILEHVQHVVSLGAGTFTQTLHIRMRTRTHRKR